ADLAFARVDAADGEHDVLAGRGNGKLVPVQGTGEGVEQAKGSGRCLLIFSSRRSNANEHPSHASERGNAARTSCGTRRASRGAEAAPGTPPACSLASLSPQSSIPPASACGCAAGARPRLLTLDAGAPAAPGGSARPAARGARALAPSGAALRAVTGCIHNGAGTDAAASLHSWRFREIRRRPFRRNGGASCEPAPSLLQTGTEN
ncbi:hypothetical protein M2103_002693, partial [Ereboglobus sp. PH5-5]